MGINLCCKRFDGFQLTSFSVNPDSAARFNAAPCGSGSANLPQNYENRIRINSGCEIHFFNETTKCLIISLMSNVWL
jgi:hypothetical protein